jgi:hypothetical protein
MRTNWWRKLTLDWPCALGDWLWWALVVVPADFLNWLTFKRAILIVGMILFFFSACQILGASDAFVFAGDAMLYFDVVTTILLVAVRGHTRQIVSAVARQVRATAAEASGMLSRYRSAARQRRNANALRRKSVSKNSTQPDDEPAIYVWMNMRSAMA